MPDKSKSEKVTVKRRQEMYQRASVDLYRRLRMFSESLGDRRDERDRRWARKESKYMTNTEV
ncbi:hypothetical protein NEUTE1DRAFT_118523 [Neurospora tetrasperma FGSC 2508]|uniref:Uncharacterized protein n=1 Tax=Neurospora tetrasperma (strain FGSC 2508 / ATCC MYA-4615 / P0657) TaxID=510951 RepID=F8N3E4_NEUT8|nr:uncharacterized protein NEUTE1DRAFT_118523 [Neurospora tetrasperma FGSC 2508]EGO51751.1 hypothetical protein NEUTE1DRAFT_118523 [Neurospora tetrasperma FGSC 2508]